MSNFISNIIYSFLIAFGVIIGASAFAGIGAIINNHPPLKTMLDLASSIKIWAVATALGGTFSSFQIIEEGVTTYTHYIAGTLTDSNINDKAKWLGEVSARKTFCSIMLPITSESHIDVNYPIQKNGAMVSLAPFSLFYIEITGVRVGEDDG